ncbi:MAG: hypothetical protein ABI172_07175 [Ginsengibacter sp.]
MRYSYNKINGTYISEEAGKYFVKIGASSTDIKQSADFQLKKDLVVEKDHNVLVPQVTIPESTK